MINYNEIINNAKKIHSTYIFVYFPNHHKANRDGYVRLHILVAEQKIGRELKSGECVHHCDMNKYNNDPSNLIVFKTNSDHSRFHQSGIKIEIEPNIYISPIQYKICKTCGKMFNKYQNKKYCSMECRNDGIKQDYIENKRKRKCDLPKKDELLHLIKTQSFVSIGRKYGVSDNAVRKWCKSYGLPYRRKDIKKICS